MLCCHDKRLRVFRLLCDRFSHYLALFCFFVVFRQKGHLFVFLRNIHFSIEILKIKILEYSYPPSQYFFFYKAFIRSFSCRRKVALCHLAEWHMGPILFLLYINTMTDGITSPKLLYADDAKKIRSITDEPREEKLKFDLNEIFKWAKSSLMKFNLTNCHTLTLTRRTKQSERNHTLNGGKQQVKVESEKDMGVIVDSRLQYREHIAKKT